MMSFVCVLVVTMLPLSTIYRLDFETVPTLRIFFLLLKIDIPDDNIFCYMNCLLLAWKDQLYH